MATEEVVAGVGIKTLSKAGIIFSDRCHAPLTASPPAAITVYR